jgi:hypothetical protein
MAEAKLKTGMTIKIDNVITDQRAMRFGLLIIIALMGLSRLRRPHRFGDPAGSHARTSHAGGFARRCIGNAGSGR